jgi:PAS domain S-box-containing protein
MSMSKQKQSVQKESNNLSNNNLTRNSSFIVFNNFQEGCLVLNNNLEYLYLNKAAERQSHKTLHEIVGKKLTDIWPGIEQSEVFGRIIACLEQQVPQIFEFDFTFLNLNNWFKISLQPIAEGVLILSTDITERKNTEISQLKEHEIYRQIFETDNAGKIISWTNGKYEINQALCHMLGYSEKELKDQALAYTTPVNEIEYLLSIIRSQFKDEKKHVRFNKGFTHKDGSIVWTDINSTLYYKNDCPDYFITTVTDISNQKKTEKALLKSEHILKLFVENAPAAIAMLDKNLQFIITSQRYLKDMEFNKDIIGQSFYDVFTNIPQKWKEAHEKCLNGETCYIPEDSFQKENGKTEWVQGEIHPWYEDDGEIGGLIIFSEIITKRILAEKALRKSEDLFNKAFHGSPSPMSITRKTDGTLIAANSSFLKLFEFSLKNPIGKINIETDLIGSENLSQIKKRMGKEGKINNLEINLKIHSKKNITVLLSMENIELAGELCYISTYQDITLLKQAELFLKEKNEEIESQNEEYQQLNEELVQINQELEEAKKRAEDSDHLKTAFLHNVSHEIRTPMNAIKGFVSLLKDNKFPIEKRKRYFDIIEQSSNQLLAIITDIIDIASIEAGHVKIFKTQVEINSVMNLIFDQYRPVAEKKGIQLICKNTLNNSEAIISTDETKVIQIITNLINNALKFTDKGEITFGYRLKNLTIEFYVKDTGIGIPLELREKIFDRFHQVESTKINSNGGSGLGLSIAKGYLDLLDGKIWTESQPGKGSTFYFTLPFENAIKQLSKV